MNAAFERACGGYPHHLTTAEPIRVDAATTALLVIDMQYRDAAAGQGFSRVVECLTPGGGDYYDARVENQVTPGIASLTTSLRPLGVRIVHLRFGSAYADYRDIYARRRAEFLRLEDLIKEPGLFWSGNPLYRIRDEIAVSPEDTVVDKHTFGAFNGSMLDETLRAMGVQTLVVVGVSTNACVETTARDAADRGYGTVLVDECLADYSPEWHQASLKAFALNFGPVLTSATEAVSAVTDSALLQW